MLLLVAGILFLAPSSPDHFRQQAGGVTWIPRDHLCGPDGPLVDRAEVVRDLTFAPDGSLILVSASRDKTLRVWDLKDDGMSIF